MTLEPDPVAVYRRKGRGRGVRVLVDLINIKSNFVIEIILRVWFTLTSEKGKVLTRPIQNKTKTI